MNIALLDAVWWLRDSVGHMTERPKRFDGRECQSMAGFCGGIGFVLLFCAF